MLMNPFTFGLEEHSLRINSCTSGDTIWTSRPRFNIEYSTPWSLPNKSYNL